MQQVFPTQAYLKAMQDRVRQDFHMTRVDTLNQEEDQAEIQPTRLFHEKDTKSSP